MPKAVKEKTSAKKRGPYKSYSEEKISSAISECHQRQKKDPDLSIQAFAEEKGISYSRLYPFCRRDEKREVYSPKGQKKKISTRQVKSFCIKLLAQELYPSCSTVIRSLQKDFATLANDITAARNQYNRVVKQMITLIRNETRSKITKNEFDTAVTACVVDNANPIVALRESVGPITWQRMIAASMFEEVGWLNLSNELHMNILGYIHPLVGDEIATPFENKQCRILVSMIELEAFNIVSQVSSTKFRSVLYIQETIPGSHALSQGSSIKDSHRDFNGVIDAVTTVKFLTLTETGCYNVPSLSIKPHGSVDRKDVSRLIDICRQTMHVQVYPDALQRALSDDFIEVRTFLTTS